jgi:carboxyl-terminal processing protease
MNDLDRNDWFLFILIPLLLVLILIQIIAPRRKDRFDVSISGVRRYWCSTSKENDYTEISELISGGPAWRGKT